MILCATAILAGCSKKPVRPSPDATVLGQSTGLAPEAVQTTDANSSLENRGPNFDPSGQLRGAVEPVYFDFDSFNIRKSEQAKFKAAKDYLEKNTGVRILLEGHCDWRGTAEYNLGLGDRRANGAKKYLVTLGVSADKIDTLSKGSEDSKQNAPESEMSKDRRVEFVIVKQ